MNGSQMFPFERNRYYQGKMLTSADFLAEQTYMNDKRRFLNKMMFGSGIVCGLNVFNLDDLSVLIESGMAIDDFGREIVIDSSVVRKMSAISGFEQITDEKVSLCVRYREEETRPVYSIYGQENGREYENNRIREGYELFLKDTSELEKELISQSEFLMKYVLFEEEDFLVWIQAPATICKNSRTLLKLFIQKKSQEEKRLDFKCILQLPAFMKGEAGQELTLECQAVVLGKGEQRIEDYWLETEESEGQEGTIVVKPGSLDIKIDRQPCPTADSPQIMFTLTGQKPEELIYEELGKASLEIQALGARDYVRLADFRLIRTGKTCIIDAVEEQKAKKYIPVPGRARKAEAYLSFFKPWEANEKKQVLSNTPDFEKTAEIETPGTAFGTLELPLDANMKKGDICYSEEIIHGLGKGNVYIAAGLHLWEDNAVIFGDPSLFEKKREECTYLETAVKVFPDRGSFQVAAKLTGEQKTVIAALKWAGIRLSSGKNALEDRKGKAEGCILPVTPTIVLKPKEKQYVHVRFQDMEPCSLRYEVSEENGGSIDQDGLYTAPKREGIYEIHIFCAESAAISAYAYAVVKKHYEKER